MCIIGSSPLNLCLEIFTSILFLESVILGTCCKSLMKLTSFMDLYILQNVWWYVLTMLRVSSAQSHVCYGTSTLNLHKYPNQGVCHLSTWHTRTALIEIDGESMLKTIYFMMTHVSTLDSEKKTSNFANQFWITRFQNFMKYINLLNP